MSDQDNARMKAFGKDLQLLLQKHGLEESLSVACGTRIDDKVFCKAFGAGNVRFTVQQEPAR